MNIQVKPGATSPHVKTQSLICGTLVTTDLKRARRMYEEVLDMECVEPDKAVMYVREKGHRPGQAKHGEPYWVLEVRETAGRRRAAGNAESLGFRGAEPGRGRRGLTPRSPPTRRNTASPACRSRSFATAPTPST